MRVANCRRVCQEIEEADAGQRLTSEAMGHVRACAECQAFYDERLRLRQLVAGLGSVEAPPDFDFRLRSRLASGKTGAGPDFLFGRFSIAFPSIAFAALLLLVGAVFALRVWQTPTTSTSAVNTDTPTAGSITGARSDQGTPGGKEKVAVNDDEPTMVNEKRRESAWETRKPKGISRGTVASLAKKNRPGTREFSVTPATVVKRDAIASLEPSAIFPIEASSQPLKVSLDYATGVSRTISVPALSFGSQRVAGEGTPVVKTSAKGAW